MRFQGRNNDKDFFIPKQREQNYEKLPTRVYNFCISFLDKIMQISANEEILDQD